MLKINLPENFQFTKPQLWPEWKQPFIRYRIPTKLNKEEDEIQISMLIYSMGKQAEHTHKSFTLEEEGKENYNTILERFDVYFVPKRNVIHKRAGFINADNMQENPSKRSSIAYTNWKRTVILRMHKMNKVKIV